MRYPLSHVARFFSVGKKVSGDQSHSPVRTRAVAEMKMPPLTAQRTWSKLGVGDFLGGPVVKNPPANAGDMGSIPGPGRSHMPWAN